MTIAMELFATVYLAVGVMSSTWRGIDAFRSGRIKAARASIPDCSDLEAALHLTIIWLDGVLLWPRYAL